MATTPRTDIDFAAYKTRLEEMKAGIVTTLSEMKSQDADGLNTTGTDRSESSAVDNHPADVATELQIRTQDAALMENEQNILHQIERALAKIEDGTYGLSDRSGEPIPLERLDVMPYAVVTVDEADSEDYVSTNERYQNG